MSGLPMSPNPPDTETGMSLDAATGCPSSETNRQEKVGPAKRLATRNGSSAP